MKGIGRSPGHGVAAALRTECRLRFRDARIVACSVATPYCPLNKYRLAMLMPLRIVPMMPTKPWSLPQTNRFRRCVAPS